MGTRALLVGINTYPESPLKGCVNDVIGVRDMLKQRYGIGDDRVRLLTDQKATKQAIGDGLRWLTQPDRDGGPAVRVFHFSGHGTFIADADGDEPDGRDECLVPVDYATTGPMTDDVLREQYARFANDTHLLLIMDCCHSGTIQRRIARDVRFRFLPNSYEEEQRIDEAAARFRARREQYVAEQLSDLRDRVVPEDEWQRRIKEAMTGFDQKRWGEDRVGGNSVLLAACRSNQTAADAHFGQAYNGAFSYYLLEALGSGDTGLTYRALLDRVGRKLYENNFRQVPQLECNTANRDCTFLNLAL